MTEIDNTVQILAIIGKQLEKVVEKMNKIDEDNETILRILEFIVERL